MVTLWRIGSDTPDFTAEDLGGIGAERSGDLPLNRYLVAITVADEIWTARTVFDPVTNVGWDAEPAGLVSLYWGTAWADGGASPLADVPSVIVPEESNVLINPRHQDAAELGATKVRRWTYNARLRPADAVTRRAGGKTS